MEAACEHRDERAALAALLLHLELSSQTSIAAATALRREALAAFIVSQRPRHLERRAAPCNQLVAGRDQREIIRAVGELPKVCENINLPFQAGDDVVLDRMRRGYTRDEYLRKIDEVRSIIPGVAMVTDVTYIPYLNSQTVD